MNKKTSTIAARRHNAYEPIVTLSDGSSFNVDKFVDGWLEAAMCVTPTATREELPGTIYDFTKASRMKVADLFGEFRRQAKDGDIAFARDNLPDAEESVGRDVFLTYNYGVGFSDRESFGNKKAVAARLSRAVAHMENADLTVYRRKGRNYVE